MKEASISTLPDFETQPEDNVIAFCKTCKKIVFKGSDKTMIGNHVLVSQTVDHVETFTKVHEVVLLRPHRNKSGAVERFDYVRGPLSPLITDYPKTYIS